MDITPSGNIKLTKEEYEKLHAGDVAEKARLREEVKTWKMLAQSALGNLSAIARKMDEHLKQWLTEDDLPVQKFE
jgi:hypothetical protein